MGERRGLNPRVVDSQSTALIHLATSAPTPAQVSVSIYDQILSEPPYDRWEAFSYTIVASLLLCFGGSKASTSRSFLEKFQFKQRGWAVHFIDLTSLDLRLKIGAGRAVKARLVDSKLRFLKRAPRKPLHASLLYRVPCAPLNYKLALKPLLSRWLGY